MIAWLVETLVATTVLMLLVLALRSPVRASFGSHAAYALWLLPALRMILPPLSGLLPASTPLSTVLHGSTATGFVRPQIVMELVTGPGPVTATVPPVSQASTLPAVMIGLWIVGLLIFAIHQYLAYRRFCGFILRDAIFRDEIVPGVMLVSSPKAKGPMAFGLRRRFIVFPTDAEKRFDEEERAMALAHELAHHTRGDLVANAVALVILTLHWCNPVAWMGYRAFRTDQEMACDADVIAAVRGSRLGHAYGRALVKSATGHEFAAACNLTTVDRLKRRLAMLSNKSPSNRRRKTGVLLAGVVVLGGLALTASGEGMAAQVGASVSEALPAIPKVGDVLPSLPSAAPAGARPVADAVDKGKENGAQETKTELHTRTIVVTTSVDDKWAPPAPPVPPVPPVPGVAPTPPVPPAPPQVMIFQSPGADGKQVRVVRSVGKREAEEAMPLLPPMPPLVEISENCDGKGEPVTSTSETRTSDGKTRTVTRVTICKRAIAGTLGAGLDGLRQARAELAREKALPDKVRDSVLANLDRSIAKLESQKKERN